MGFDDLQIKYLGFNETSTCPICKNKAIVINIAEEIVTYICKPCKVLFHVKTVRIKSIIEELEGMKKTLIEEKEQIRKELEEMEKENN